MTTHWHRISDINETTRTGTCAVCGPVRLRRRVRNDKVQWSCGPRHNQYWRPAHRRHLAPMCEACGFAPKHESQLDGHHINGDHFDNRPTNIATLCANCHRLVHALGPAALESPVWAAQLGNPEVGAAA